MAKKTKNKYCYTFKSVVKTSDNEDKSLISDKLEADDVLDAFDSAIKVLEKINARDRGYYFLECLYKDED